MSIASAIQDLNDGLLDAYTAVGTKGGTIPANKNLDNLPDAIESISGGGVEPEFFGCTEGVEEMNYLEDIMPDLLNMKYKGELKWA